MKPKILTVGVYLFTFIISVLLGKTTGYAQSSGCEDVNAIYVEVLNSEQTGKKKIFIKVPEGTSMSAYKIYLIAPRKENNRLDVNENEIEGLLPGQHLLIIQSNRDNNCTRRVSVEI